MNELYHLFFGDATLAQVIFNFTMLTVGSALHISWNVKQGIKKSTTPNGWNYKYFLKENAVRLFAGFLIMFCTLVYMEELIHYFSKYIPNTLARLSPLIFGALNDRFYVWAEKLIEYVANKINSFIDNAIG